ncbi:helix-turn-helix domain-containing protein [Halobacteria archaeon HArc-gm2]|nr:helix-turn-helix domain-containing protein [Halobacteria archaeon HArc-gm2]
MLDRDEAPRRRASGVRAASEALSAAASPQAVADVLVEVVTAIRGIDGAAAFLMDGTAGSLRETASTFDRDDRSLVDGIGTIARDAYVDGDPVVCTELNTDSGTAASATIEPLGGYGTLVSVTSGATVDGESRTLLTSLAAVATHRLERIECERGLRRCTRDRQRDSARLARFDDVTDVMFGLERAVTAATSRADIERTVCERLAASEGIAFAWVGHVGPDDERVVPAATAGRERGYLDAVDRTLTSSNSEPAVVAARDREATTVGTVASGRRSASWRREALARDVQSAQAVPLTVDDRFAGVLAVYSADDSAGTDLWRRTLDHVAAVVTHAVGSLDRKRALLSDAVVELELQLVGGDDVFGRVARAAETDLRLDGVTTSNGQLVLFLTTGSRGDGSVESTLAGDPAVASVKPVRRDDADCLEVLLREEWLLSHFVEAGAVPQSVEATADGTRVVLTLPTDADVEGFVDSLERRYDKVGLRSRRERTRPVAREQHVWAKLEESLTDRQLETLRTAYLSGYFEWPRESTGEEVAQLLDISQPTFSRHLRTAERKLLSLLFVAEQS